MIAAPFEDWLAELLREDRDRVKVLLHDRGAIHFLFAWSLLEAESFDRFATAEKLDTYAAQLIAEGFDVESVRDAGAYFHDRYQDRARFDSLMHRQPSRRMTTLLSKPFSSLLPTDIVLLVLVVNYRYRNNMFHGNTGVVAWLEYTEQIQLCTATIQSIVTHAVRLRRASHAGRSQ